jgi:hypothetical protein
MNKQRKGATLALGVGLVFVGLEILFHVQTAIAGVFVVGMAGGLLIGDEMARHPSTPVQRS